MPSVIARPARIVASLVVPLLVVAASACSSGSDSGADAEAEETRESVVAPSETGTPRPPGDPVSASEICDGTLSPEAGEALQLLTGATEFNEPADAPAADLAAYAERLPTSEAYYDDFCHIGVPGGEEPFARIAFGLRETANAPEVPGPMEIRYTAGDYAYATNASAIVVFPCATAGPGWVEANLYTSEDSPETRDAQITLATSLSRALADHLGCLDDAGLPEGVPERSPES
ncbi:hypothetical protein [Streptomyces avicenniae]|uniref:hypothetical protein n=1 Tax=Streptomyces avicenniae TaxID=500153 RepID=UPI00069940A0|nr:hypothetical protein [Streptomyces avicenniae]